MKLTTVISFILVIVGALNWFLVGVFSFDLVAMIFGAMTTVTRIIYALVGLAALWLIVFAAVCEPLSKPKNN